jgi:hypothetical protein
MGMYPHRNEVEDAVQHPKRQGVKLSLRFE